MMTIEHMMKGIYMKDVNTECYVLRSTSPCDVRCPMARMQISNDLSVGSLGVMPPIEVPVEGEA